eukprot:m.748566 g.748566  ORF g.748566 m.748566 type:complete len:340 (-) comp23148_c0_seq65:724-1743(-)
MLSIASVAFYAFVVGHGMMTVPPSRNARDEHFFNKSTNAWYHCNSPAITDDVRPGGYGQPCLWFSQGCTIGCSQCDNHTQHTFGKPLCTDGIEPTVNSPRLRTMNIENAAGSVNDSYRYNPWRAPGSAPVNDPCGMAGGRHPSDAGGGDAEFTATPWATLGDLGSKVLNKGSPTANWTAGSTVEVEWAIRYNHGGGYQYRLCPASEPLTEECFQKMPLEFTGMPSLRWTDGTRTWFEGVYVSEGTTPKGSTWAQNPIPRIHFDSTSSGQPTGFDGCQKKAKGIQCRQFKPYACPDEPINPLYNAPWHAVTGEPEPNTDIEGMCSGDWVRTLLPLYTPPS